MSFHDKQVGVEEDGPSECSFYYGTVTPYDVDGSGLRETEVVDIVSQFWWQAAQWRTVHDGRGCSGGSLC